ncbi:hypothetical protein P355_1774 [Burkholderia cenocepacia KC-01]|nr:hypothetical protein P355_1774 [Burkholderia cenocepacia KC-01]
MTKRPGRPPCRSGRRADVACRGIGARHDTFPRRPAPLDDACSRGAPNVSMRAMRPIVAKHRDSPLFVAFLRQSDCLPPVRRVWCSPSASDPSPDTRPSSRTTAVRAVPAAHRLRDAARRRRAFMRKEA